MKPVSFKGSLYSPEHKYKFSTEHSVAEVKDHPSEKNKLLLLIDGLGVVDWFRNKQREFLEKRGKGMRR